MESEEKKTKKKQYSSLIDYRESRGYDVHWTENIMFLRRIIGCLRGENTKEDTRLLIKQLQDRIIEVTDGIKSEALPPWLRE